MFGICAFALFNLFQSFLNLDNWALTIWDLNAEVGFGALNSNWSQSQLRLLNGLQDLDLIITLGPIRTYWYPEIHVLHMEKQYA